MSLATKKKSLFDDSDSDGQNTVTTAKHKSNTSTAKPKSTNKSQGEEIRVNEKFARVFEHNKRRELLQRMKDKGEDEGDSESSSSDEDSDAELVTPKVDAKIHEVLVRLKSRDPSIYDNKHAFFKDSDFEGASDEDPNAPDQKKKKKEKPIHLRDYERQLLLESGGLVDSDEEVSAPKTKKQAVESLQDEQARLKKEFLDAAEGNGDDDDDNEGSDQGDSSLFRVKQKSQQQLDDEERRYKEFRLKRGEYLNEYFGSRSNLSNADKFLLDYLNNEGWVDKGDNTTLNFYNNNDNNDHGDDDGDADGDGDGDGDGVAGVDLDADEDELTRQDNFEAAYNHRFEEENADKIVTHPRKIEGSVRAKTSKRQKQREERNARKEQEKIAKQEELKRIKALKRAEIEEKLKQIREMAGEDGLAIDESFFDDDFDTEKFDRQMSKTFGDNYYKDDAQQQQDDDDDNYDTNDNSKAGENGAIDSFDDHADEPTKAVDKMFPDKDHTTKRKGFMEAVERTRAIGHRGTKAAIDSMLDEYYKLDYEDLIGDVPCRFKYKTVKANSCNLTTEDILLSDVKDLNRYAPLKLLQPYREREFRPRGQFQPSTEDRQPRASWGNPFPKTSQQAHQQPQRNQQRGAGVWGSAGSWKSNNSNSKTTSTAHSHAQQHNNSQHNSTQQHKGEHNSKKRQRDEPHTQSTATSTKKQKSGGVSEDRLRAFMAASAPASETFTKGKKKHD